MILWGAQGGTGGGHLPPPACMLKKALQGKRSLGGGNFLRASG